MDDFEAFLPYFERELALLRQRLLPFERKFPKTAARLSLSGGQSDDPHVERMLQSAAWVNARAAQRIDDGYPELGEALIETTFPAYLRPVPSCSIAHFDALRMFEGRTRAFAIPRGTRFLHNPSLCQFNTVYDVSLAPLTIVRAKFSPPAAMPSPGLGIAALPDDTAGIISIEFAAPGRRLTPGSELMPPTLRLFLHADRALAATLTDAVLLHPHAAFVEADHSQRWRALAKHPASAVGFDTAQAIANEPQRARQPALRLLIEYAAFPDKFRFVDLDFAALLQAAGPCATLTLHLPVTGPAATPASAKRLGLLKAEHLKLNCTPVVNAFEVEANRIDVKADRPAYPVTLPESKTAPVVVHSIDSVQMMKGQKGEKPGDEIPPHHALKHWSPVGAFWVLERDRWIARETTGSDVAIRLVDLDEQPFVPDAAQLAVKLTCTNGDLSGKLEISSSQGGLQSETLNLGGPIALLVDPSAYITLPRDDDALWRLIAALSPNRVTLSPLGLAIHQNLLYQFGVAASPEATDYIRGIIGLDCRTISPTMRIDPVPMPILVPGLQVTLTIDITSFAGNAVHTFALLMEQYFLRFAERDCIQLLVVSQDGAALYRGEPLLGRPDRASL